nr:hypothetical protein [Tanacetum cinerariifolium]
MLKIDVEPIALKLLKNKTVHSDYHRHTQEYAVILRKVVKQGKSQNPLNNSLDHTCCDPLALVDSFTPVEDNTGLSETRFDKEAVFVFVFPEDVTGSVNITLLALVIGVTSTNLPLELLMLGHVCLLNSFCILTSMV